MIHYENVYLKAENRFSLIELNRVFRSFRFAGGLYSEQYVLIRASLYSILIHLNFSFIMYILKVYYTVRGTYSSDTYVICIL